MTYTSVLKLVPILRALIWHPMFQYYTSRFNLVQLQTTLCHCSEVRRKCWPIKSSDFLYSKKMFLSRRFYILMQISVKYNWPFVREKHGLENLSNAKYALLQTYYLLCEFFGYHYVLSVMTHIYPISLVKCIWNTYNKTYNNTHKTIW